jgi:drug/metabolite transporter (DMT)-like permease
VSAPLGALAAVGTAVAFAFSSTVLTLASLRAGAMAVNRVRLVMAVAWLWLAHLAARLPLPLDVGGERWLLLGASGIVGLVLGDAFLFQAFVEIGPRLSMLLMSLAPALASLLAWWFLGEALSLGELAGMLVTLGGIAWVVLERDGQAAKSGPDPGRGYLRGILYGLGGAAGQAGGLVLAKEAVADGFPALSATLMRMVVATVTLWLYTALRGQMRETARRFAGDRPAWTFTLAGSFLGPFLGVTLSIVAIQHIEVGIASTLMALPPVFLLPICYVVFRERFGWQAVVGTCVALLGVALMFLTP